LGLLVGWVVAFSAFAAAAWVLWLLVYDQLRLLLLVLVF
jgi:hypothetical protein